MKKVASLLLAVALLTTPIFAFAELDVASMSLDELVSLWKQIDKEISKRMADAQSTYTLIYPSVYVVGKDIKAGEYVFTNTGDEWSQINWWPTEEAHENESYTFEVLYSGDIYRLVLTDGMVFEICGSYCRIEKAPPMIFAP